jgi:hypothetical protein
LVFVLISAIILNKPVLAVDHATATAACLLPADPAYVAAACALVALVRVLPASAPAAVAADGRCAVLLPLLLLLCTTTGWKGQGLAGSSLRAASALASASR